MMAFSNVAHTRPHSIRIFGCVFVLAMCFYPVVLQAGYRSSTEEITPVSWLTISSMIILQLGVLYRLWQGNWRQGRLVIIVLLALDILMYMIIVPNTAIYDPTYLGLSVVQFLLHFTCVFLLFLNSSSSWLLQNSSPPRAT